MLLEIPEYFALCTMNVWVWEPNNFMYHAGWNIYSLKLTLIGLMNGREYIVYDSCSGLGVSIFLQFSFGWFSFSPEKSFFNWHNGKKTVEPYILFVNEW